MQVQRHLYRVSQRVFKQQQTKKYCWVAFFVSSIFAIFFFLLFIYANSSLNNINTSLLGRCYNSTKYLHTLQNGEVQFVPKLKIKSDEIWLVYQQTFNVNLQQNNNQNKQQKVQDKIQSKENKVKGQKIVQNQYCTVYKNLSFNLTKNQGVILQFARSRGLLTLSIQQRKKFKIENYTIMLNYGFIQKAFMDTSAILINQLMLNSQFMTVKRKTDQRPYFKTSRSTFSPTYFIQNDENQQKSKNKSIFNRIKLIAQKGFKVFKLLFFYVLISVGTSMYIYATIISAPALIIMILSCTRFGQGDNLTQVYRIFPWIGLHTMIRRTAGHPKVKASVFAVCGSMLLYFLITYLIYYAIILKANYVIFGMISQAGVQQLFFSFMALIQFATIIFMRTRPFIKYYPKIHSLLMIGFLIYCQFIELGYKKLLLHCIISCSFALFLWMVIRTQIPASTIWDKNRHYTPTIDRPRIGMNPVFNMSWMNSLPEQWSRFIPLQGRQNFTVGELGLVDKNYQALDQALQGQVA